jgi:hypothetical protein
MIIIMARGNVTGWDTMLQVASLIPDEIIAFPQFT